MSEGRRELAWHVLWSASGFGTTTARLVELRQAAKDDDPESQVEMYFPTYVDRAADGKEVMVPLFPNYAFIKCRWHAGLDDRIREASGLGTVFLRMPGQGYPHPLSEEEMDGVRSALERRLEDVGEWLHADGIAVGDTVRVRNMDIVGTVLHFLPPSRAMIRTILFRQEQEIVAKISDLERI